MPTPETYRASFTQPILRTDQLQVKVGGNIIVEIYPFGRGWRARAAANGAQYDQVGTKSFTGIKTAVENLFEFKTENWYPCDKNGRRIETPAAPAAAR